MHFQSNALASQLQKLNTYVISLSKVNSVNTDTRDVLLLPGGIQNYRAQTPDVSTSL